MADAPRRADAVWQGSLASGSGEVSLTTSGAAGPLAVTWASRTERSNGKTSPEELVAAAHASCYNMALSHTLAEAGTPPDRLETSVTVTFKEIEGGWKTGSSRDHGQGHGTRDRRGDLQEGGRGGQGRLPHQRGAQRQRRAERGGDAGLRPGRRPPGRACILMPWRVLPASGQDAWGRRSGFRPRRPSSSRWSGWPPRPRQARARRPAPSSSPPVWGCTSSTATPPRTCATCPRSTRPDASSSAAAPRPGMRPPTSRPAKQAPGCASTSWPRCARPIPPSSQTVGAGGLRNDSLVFDRQGRAYNPVTLQLRDGTTRNALLVSWDHCRTWKVFDLPEGTFTTERSVGHNELDGPPFLAVWRRSAPPDLPGSQTNALYVTQPRLEGDQLVLPPLVKVTERCLGLSRDSGGASFAVTRGETTWFVWSETAPSGKAARRTTSPRTTTRRAPPADGSGWPPPPTAATLTTSPASAWTPPATCT